MATHGVLFDVGYGLCDESRRLAAALEHLSVLLDQAGWAQSPEQLDALYRRTCQGPPVGRSSILTHMLLELGLPPQLAGTLRGELTWDAQPLDLLPGAIDTLRRLRDAGLRVAVLANQPASAAADLDRLGVTPLLDDLWLSEAVGLHKPDPAFFQLALRAWKLPADRIAYVGDRPDNDIAPANGLGLHTVRLRLGPHADQPAQNDPQIARFDAHSLPQAADHLLHWASRSS